MFNPSASTKERLAPFKSQFRPYLAFVCPSCKRLHSSELDKIIRSCQLVGRYSISPAIIDLAGGYCTECGFTAIPGIIIDVRYRDQFEHHYYETIATNES